MSYRASFSRHFFLLGLKINYSRERDVCEMIFPCWRCWLCCCKYEDNNFNRHLWNRGSRKSEKYSSTKNIYHDFLSKVLLKELEAGLSVFIHFYISQLCSCITRKLMDAFCILNAVSSFIIPLQFALFLFSRKYKHQFFFFIRIDRRFLDIS